MRFFSPLLALKIAKGIGMAAAGAAGGAGAHRIYSESWKNDTIPPAQVKEVDPLSERSFSDEQIEMAQFLWKDEKYMNRELIDYQNRDAWLQQAKKYSLLSDQWPGDIIFIEDKSDTSLAKLLRDKCYSVSRWFLVDSLNDSNPHLKEQFKNVKDSFKLVDLKDLCSTEKSTDEKDKEGEKSISNVRRTTLRNLEGFSCYTCNESMVSKGRWMEEIYNLKKEGRDGNSKKACNIVPDNGIVVIEYSDGSKKYEIRKSQRAVGGSSGYISVPREDWIFYSGFEEMPGFTQMFTKKK